MKIYLAGPEVFFPDALQIGHKKVAICAEYGAEGLYPLDTGVGPGPQEILRGNRMLMANADAIIANLTPFRGPSADAGTVFELGLMAGERKLCFGYSNDPRLYAERAAQWKRTTPDGEPTDFAIEDFALADNLMIAQTLLDIGHPMVRPAAPPADIWRDLAGFEECVRLAVQTYAQTAVLPG